MEDLWEKGSLLEKQEPLLLLAGRVKWKKKDREKLFMRRTDQLFSTSSGLRCLHCWIWIIFLDRNSSKDIDQICFGFFKSPLHLSKQFSYVTRSDDLTGQIRSSLVVQLGKTPLPTIVRTIVRMSSWLQAIWRKFCSTLISLWSWGTSSPTCRQSVRLITRVPQSSRISWSWYILLSRSLNVKLNSSYD